MRTNERANGRPASEKEKWNDNIRKHWNKTMEYKMRKVAARHCNVV